MDALKRHFSLVIAAVVTLVGTGLLVYLFMSARSQVAEQRQLLERIKIDKKAVFDFRWALNESNRQMTKNNLKIAAAAYQKELDQIAQRFERAQGENLTPINTADLLRQQGEVMRARLTTEGVAFTPDTGKFTLNKYLDGTQLPKQEEIPKITKQLQILDELVAVVGRSRVDSLEMISRDQDKLDLESSDGYSYYEYQLRVKGNAESIRRFTNELINARYFFVIRNLTVSAEDLTKSMKTGSSQDDATPGRPPAGAGRPPAGAGRPPAGAGRPPAGAGRVPVATTPDVTGRDETLFKENRLAFTDMASVTLDVTLDYVEFVENPASVKMREEISAQQ